MQRIKIQWEGYSPLCKRQAQCMFCKFPASYRKFQRFQTRILLGPEKQLTVSNRTIRRSPLTPLPMTITLLVALLVWCNGPPFTADRKNTKKKRQFRFASSFTCLNTHRCLHCRLLVSKNGAVRELNRRKDLFSVFARFARFHRTHKDPWMCSPFHFFVWFWKNKRED